MPHVLRQITPWGVHGEPEFVGQALQHMPVVFGRGLAASPRLDHAVGQRLGIIGDDQIGVDLQLVADAIAHRAGPVWRIERERAGLDLVQLQLMPVRTGPVLRERLTPIRVLLVQVHEIGDDDTFGQPQRGLDRISKPLSDAVADHQTIHHDLDGVLFLLGELDVVGQLAPLTVDQRAGIAVAAQQLQKIGELPLAAAYNGRENLESRAFRVLQQRVHHLLRGLRADQLAAFGAMRYACAGEQQSQIVINLGDRAHGRTRIAVCGLLVDRHRRAQSLDEIHIRLVHLPEELTRIRGQRLHIPALPLREQRIERER